jgi:hypothetical protein
MSKKAQISPPEGFRYQPGVISIDEEQELIKHIRELPLKEYEFHGFTARRRVTTSRKVNQCPKDSRK